MKNLATLVTESRAAQGLPPTVEDGGVLRKVATLLATNDEGRSRHRTGPIDCSLTTITTIARKSRRLDGT